MSRKLTCNHVKSPYPGEGPEGSKTVRILDSRQHFTRTVSDEKENERQYAIHLIHRMLL